MIGASSPRSLFETCGYFVESSVLTAAESAVVVDWAKHDTTPALDWIKGRAATSRLFYDLATHPPILDAIAELIGPNVVLWGAHLVVRVPGQVHPWHSDIESALAGVGTASAWIGLENTLPSTSMTLIERSHRFDVPIQREAQARGFRRGTATAADLDGWARERDPKARSVTPAVGDGDALIFDGRLWHGSHNQAQGTTRTAVLLQYASAATSIRLPDFTQLAWPFRFLESPRPPCLVVRGDTPLGINRIVPAPADSAIAANALPRLSHLVRPLHLPLDPAPAPFQPHPIAEGGLASLAYLESHVSALLPGHSPHPPHRHPEEEVLLLLRGEVDIDLPDLPAEDGTTRKRLRAGQFAYYPAMFAHTIEARGTEPANYLMFKWRGRRRLGAPPGGARTAPILDLGLDRDPAADGVLPPRPILDLKTDWLRCLHCHVSTRLPGTGYATHIDAHELLLVTLEGEIEVDTGSGEWMRVGPYQVVLHAAGEPHGLRVVGAVPARYAVFELHAAQDDLSIRLQTATRDPAATPQATAAATTTAPRPLPLRVALHALAHAVVYRARTLLGLRR